MKSGITTHPHHVCYVLRIDGRLNSKHQCFADAIRAGLQLKDRFPQHDIKVSVVQTRNPIEDVKRKPVLHWPPRSAFSEVRSVINLKTAKALGITVPSSLLATAGEVIE